jgi:cytochrome c oxidase subunit 2
LPSALDPAGPASTAIGRLYWVLLALCVFVYVAVMAAALAGALAKRGKEATAGTDRRLRFIVSVAIGLTVVAVLGVLALSARTGSALASTRYQQGIEIRVTGHQWWWQIEYPGSAPQDHFETANELHVPIGTPIHLSLMSDDVIHSLWTPNLHGKRDLFPGRTTTLDWVAEREGVYRGVCAEFCGHQHAHMGLLVVAEAPAAFEAWSARQRRNAAAPQADAAQRGKDIFLSAQCALCHTVRGTPAGGRMGPELTHVGSRQTIAAATLPNQLEPLKGWISNPQASKPGNLMPPSPLSQAQIADVAAYLQELR